jgi:Zn ribbon nucleic-acid-binding protein
MSVAGYFIPVCSYHFVVAVWSAKRIHEQEFVECYEEVCCRIYRHVRARLCWNSQSINNPPFRQIGVARRRDFPKIKR